jgi:hypothetical protein
MELFDILKCFFTQKKWDEVSKIDKGKNFFMINRIMSISFPLQANAFNNTKIDPVSVIDYWRSTLNIKYKTVPGWFYTATIKRDKVKNFTPPEDVAEIVKAKYEISNREIAELSKFYPKEFKDFCKSISEQIG